jgi:cytidylate kinase
LIPAICVHPRSFAAHLFLPIGRFEHPSQIKSGPIRREVLHPRRGWSIIEVVGGFFVGKQTKGSHMSPINPILAAVRSHIHTVGESPGDAQRSQPFITISREAGAGGRTLMRRLVDRLNELDPAGPARPPWTGFDKELVEKVAQDHKLHKTLVNLLGEQCHSWLYDVFAGLSSQTTEIQVYRRVAETIRGLAQGGRVVTVGRGGVFITQNMPMGVHIQVVAPLEHRIEQMARLMQSDERTAAAEVRRIDQNRESFYRRYWPDTPLSPSVFTATFNSAAISEETMVEAILPLIPGLKAKEKHPSDGAVVL